MTIPDNVETVILKPNDFQLLGVAVMLMVIFVIGAIIAIQNGQVGIVGMLLAIFGCLTVQGMRR